MYMDACQDKKRISNLRARVQAVLNHPVWVLGPGLGSSGREASALHHLAVSPAPKSWFQVTESLVFSHPFVLTTKKSGNTAGKPRKNRVPLRCWFKPQNP